jgi:hypothetical protein
MSSRDRPSRRRCVLECASTIGGGRDPPIQARRRSSKQRGQIVNLPAETRIAAILGFAA